jgi:hypothetical protein
MGIFNKLFTFFKGHLLAKLPATATSCECTCFCFLGQHDTDRIIPIYVALTKVAKASK